MPDSSVKKRTDSSGGGGIRQQDKPDRGLSGGYLFLSNNRLVDIFQEDLEELRRSFELSDRAVRMYMDFQYQTQKRLEP